ncbi:MAG: ribosome hibernation-promoting factor, HPF/YfiA family [Patescibacteria group bacterium]
MANININIKSRNMELTNAMEKYARKKVSSLEKYVKLNEDTAVFAQVELGKEVRDQMTGDIFVASMDLDIAGEVYHVEAEQSDLYAAIDEMRDEIIRVVRSSQNKKKDLFRRGSLKIKEMIRGMSGKE